MIGCHFHAGDAIRSWQATPGRAQRSIPEKWHPIMNENRHTFEGVEEGQVRLVVEGLQLVRERPSRF